MTTQIKKEASREVKYDLLRCVASFAIITVHAIPPVPETYFQWWFHSAITPILLSFVGIYFMLSGLLILNRETKELAHYYYKRFYSIVIPLFLYSCVYVAYTRVTGGYEGSILNYFSKSLKDFINGTISTAPHLWFMYTLLALYICAPFLSRMLQSLSDRELSIMVWLMICLQGTISYGSIAGFYLPVPLFTGWTLYFILGYSLKRLYKKSNYPLFLILGIFSLLITLLQKKFFPAQTPNIHDLAPTMIFICCCIFLFFEFYCHVNSKLLKLLITWVSRYSYGIYLIHFLILQHIIKPRIASSRIATHYLLEVFCSAVLTFILSTAFSIVYDCTIVRFVQWLLTKWRTYQKYFLSSKEI